MTAVVAVLPVFDPGPALVDLVAEVAPQVERVVLVDDGSRAEATASLLDACRGLGADVVRHEHNRGIAAALNSGVEAAAGRAPDAVLTLDQDSRVSPHLVADLVLAWQTAVAAGLRVGLVAPEHVTGLPSQLRRVRGVVALGRDPIQSGVLLPLTTWGVVGSFDADLFIDGVDADYALRVLDAGLSVVIAGGASLTHRLGAGHDVTVAGRRLRLTRTATFRAYYLARNRARLVRRYARRHPGWAAGQTVGLVRHLVVSLVLMPERGRRAAETWRGLRDAARGVTGPRP